MYKKIIYLIYLIIAVIIQADVYGQSNKPAAFSNPAPVVAPLTTYPNDGSLKLNYVRTKDAIAPISDPNTFETTDYTHVKEATQYLDGLARPLQTVMRQATSGGNPRDLVMPVLYDNLGRETLKYLPYVQIDGSQDDGSFKMDPFTSQENYYQSTDQNLNPALNDDEVYYSKTVFDGSPLNRPSKMFAPGDSWAGTAGSTEEHGVKTDYLVNTDADAVRIWSITNRALTYTNNDVTTNIPVSSGSGFAYFSAEELYKTVTTDEDGKQVIEFKDKEGQVILKKVQLSNTPSDSYTGWLCTYYVYDELNRLRFVIPPKAVEQEEQNGGQLSADAINELCFRYEYDARKRMIAKKVPGAGWVYMIYDARDRLVYTQDANMRLAQQWMVILYDVLNRPITSGMVNYDGTKDQLQQYVDGSFNNTPGNIDVGSVQQAIPADKLINTTLSGTQIIKATHSVTLNPGGILDGTAGTVTLLIDGSGSGSTGGMPENIEVLNNPIPPGSIFVPLTITYFDNYSFTTKTFSPNLNSRLDAGVSPYQNAYPEALPSSALVATKGLVTGGKVRVIENPADLSQGKMLESVTWYDSKARVIQVQSDNNNAGTDISANSYDFTNRVICNYLVQDNPSSPTPSTQVKTNMYYDHSGKLISISKTINDDNKNIRLIERNTYDPLGELVTKQLGQKKDDNGNFTGDAMEDLNYEYNIRGWLKSINKSHTKVPDNKWFSMELSYDEGFEHNQYNGNISGETWKSKGDGQQRAYGFSYDNLNRLMYADFSQFSGQGSWDISDGVNFSMQMGDGTDPLSAYDANGNIKYMQQYGLKLNTSTAIDKMTYTYDKANQVSNKLLAVTEDAAIGTLDNKLGDFTDKNTSLDDYSYDDNGNLTTDKNKAITAIIYNHLNLPSAITVTGKGTITYTYDAAGTKLKKVTVDESTAGKTITTTTDYLGGFVYESKATVPTDADNPDYTDVLQFFGHEEGRVRYKKADNTVSPAIPASFVYDYFIKDHLGNVRTVLTDETDPTQVYQARMETDTRDFENKLFSKIDETADTKPPGFDTDGDNQKVSKLYSATGMDKRIGPGVMLKVMAGDKFKAQVYGWYQPGATDASPQNGLPDILEGLINALSGSIAAAGAKSSAIEIVNSGILTDPLTQFSSNNHNDNGTLPKAYLNWMVLDEEQFKLVEGNAGAIPIPEITGSMQKQLMQAANGDEIEIKKNGYLYVYVSNESKGNVYFDDLRIDYTKGPLMEETHYYPFGLTMAGISSKAAGGLENKYKYNKGSELQSKEFSDGSGLELYATNLRSLDPQLGRWWQIDSKPDYAESPYSAMGDNPISINDPIGDTPIVVMNKSELKKQMMSDYSKQQKSVIERNKANKQNAKPLIAFTGAITKGSFALKGKAFGVGVEYSASKNEKDIAGVRDNEKNKSYRNGMSASVGADAPGIPVGVGGGGSVTVESKNPMKDGTIPSDATIEKKTSISTTSNVTTTNAQGNTIYSGTETEIVGFKGAFYYGVDVSISVNIPTQETVSMPSPVWENPADNTSVKTTVPTFKPN